MWIIDIVFLVGARSDFTNPTGGLLARFLTVSVYDSIFFAFGYVSEIDSFTGVGVAVFAEFFFPSRTRFLLSK